MQVFVNGKSRRVAGALSVADLLNTLEMRPEMVHVQVNGEVVARENVAAVTLKENDEVDIIMAMGGGACAPMLVGGGEIAKHARRRASRTAASGLPWKMRSASPQGQEYYQPPPGHGPTANEHFQRGGRLQDISPLMLPGAE